MKVTCPELHLNFGVILSTTCKGTEICLLAETIQVNLFTPSSCLPLEPLGILLGIQLVVSRSILSCVSPGGNSL